MNRRIFLLLNSLGFIPNEKEPPKFEMLEFNDRGLLCTSERHYSSSKLRTTEEQLLFEKLHHETYQVLRQYSVFSKTYKVDIEQESKYYLYVHSQRYHAIFYFDDPNAWYKCKNDLFDICRHFEIDVKIVKPEEAISYYANFFVEGF